MLQEYYLKNLASSDLEKRLEAVHELANHASLNSSNDPISDPSERIAVIKAIRPLLKDPDAKVRRETDNWLCVLGDDDALLEMLTPRPTKEYLRTDGAWSIASWARGFSSDRVPSRFSATLRPTIHNSTSSLWLFSLVTVCRTRGIRTRPRNRMSLSTSRTPHRPSEKRRPALSTLRATSSRQGNCLPSPSTIKTRRCS